MVAPTPSLNRIQKVAIFLTALGAEGAANVLRHFPEPQAVGILNEIADLKGLDEETVRGVLVEFQAGTDAELRLRMGPEYAALLVQKAFGSDGDRLIGRLDRQLRPPPFAGLAGFTAEALNALLGDESNQIAALVLAFLPSEMAAEVLPLLGPQRAVDIGRRIMAIETDFSPELTGIEAGLLAKHERQHTARPADSPRGLAEILANVTDSAAERILTALEVARPELVEALRSKMLTFHDIRHLTDAGIRLLIAKIPMDDWAMALKGAPAETRDVLDRHLSSRAKERLAETIELLGPQPRRMVDEARGRIMQAVKSAETDGELMFRRGADEYIT
ncbi:MAG: hypothetical protein H7338_11905 [Candidatus Sericytochromatia bacterium]|nr:hypothetical protein [Candidatus Sericytochromatia bacterium]